MSKPEDTQKPQPEDKNLADSLKGFDLSSTEEKIKDGLRNGLKKGFSIARKAKDALSGNEAAKKELTDAASDALVKGAETVERAKNIAKDVLDKADKKFYDPRKPK